MTKETTYFKIISHFGGKKDDYSNVIMVIESSNDLKQWRKIYSSSNLDETITWLASIILVNKLQDSYFVIADFMICHQIVTKVYYETQKQENQEMEYGTELTKNQITKIPSYYGDQEKYTAKLRINNDRIIEVEGLSGPFSCKFIGCTPPISESNETDENYCCDECLLQNQTSIDDEEICKDLMLDEVISSQHLEIERLTEIIQDLVTTNLKLVEILASKK